MTVVCSLVKGKLKIKNKQNTVVLIYEEMAVKTSKNRTTQASILLTETHARTPLCKSD
jgi:hypothetical protein